MAAFWAALGLMYGGAVIVVVGTDSNQLTLPSYTAISGNSYSLAHPIGWLREVLTGFAPFVLLLQFVQLLVAFGEDERAHQDPFGDDGAVDSGRGGDGDVGLGEEGVGDEVVDAGGEEVD